MYLLITFTDGFYFISDYQLNVALRECRYRCLLLIYNVLLSFQILKSYILYYTHSEKKSTLSPHSNSHSETVEKKNPNSSDKHSSLSPVCARIPQVKDLTNSVISDRTSKIF